ncbi:MAG: tRNA preQ1(34) S-adenosylmethionine ribosyltransferase-isomerase QueA [Geminicoccaceae bacterium]|nr:MAG: tRNA preQ1(34) S-adenosylmethionine ribosyltransferase-isomerase QueA [Geminicoccaceae bacterium]
MRLDHFDFDLPRRQIAQMPVSPRERARLLHVGLELVDRRVADLLDLLDAGDLMVVNDTKVIPARLFGRRGGARIELLLHEPLGGHAWRCFAKPARKLRPGDRVEIAPGFAAHVTAQLGGGEVEVDLVAERDVEAALETHGVMPLPPYIQRPVEGATRDRHDYQTIFAARPGAVAAPTASLHLTTALMTALAAKGVPLVRLTLHVGAGTFLPVKVEDSRDHRMHAERFEVDAAAAATLTAHRAAGGRIFACGTTVLRTLETVHRPDGRFVAMQGKTDLFLRPGVAIRSADRLLTNFHLPKSTLFMLVAAFSGLERMRRVYAHAVRAGYRFFSYGDACLLERTAR